jgi:Sec-independent protein translocase protein TatA
MLNIGLGELLLIAIICLLVIKPEDLPKIAHKLGAFSQYSRRMLDALFKGLQ